MPQDWELPETPEVGEWLRGAKAAYLTLRGLGVKTSGWDRSLTDLNADWSEARIARTTLILAAPE